VAAAVAGGASARSAAGRFGVSVSTAIRWAQRARVEGHAKPRAMGGDRRSRLPAHRAVVMELLAHQPDLTLHEIRDTLTGQGISVGIASLWRFLKMQNITLKKRVCAPSSRIGPT
jgi:transposase